MPKVVLWEPQEEVIKKNGTIISYMEQETVKGQHAAP